MDIHRRKLLAAAAAAAAAALVGCSDSSSGKMDSAGSSTGLAPEPNTGADQPGKTVLGDRPNILLLCIDDLNDWVGYLGTHPGVYTPNIDRLRAQSYSFNRAYCSVPVCIASRASVMWGLSPESTKVDDSYDIEAYKKLLQSRELRTLPQFFSEAGYETLSTGKVFHWGMGTKRFWDVFQPYKEAGATFGDHGTLFDYGLMEPGEVHTDQVSANFAIEQLNAERAQPWFMAIGLYQPHVPWRLPKWAFDLHPLDKVVLPQVRADDLDDIPGDGVELARLPVTDNNGIEVTQNQLVMDSGLWPQHVQAYLAACSHTDAMVGQILDALDNSAYADNTAVVLWSDNGYHLGEKLHWRKMALWERANRVPLLIRAPGVFEAGGSFDHPVSLLDLAPTLTDLAGIPQPAQFEGHSLLGITPEIAAQRPAEMRWGDAFSTRVGKWRWTRYPDGGEELYDLSTDPQEYNNLLGKTGKHQGGLATLT
ncbi:Choline-sulfatase [Halioglobus japonicus]|nr:Choline-sulfatase [Halioglobus japonicus]